MPNTHTSGSQTLTFSRVISAIDLYEFAKNLPDEARITVAKDPDSGEVAIIASWGFVR